jgi:PA14 domain
LGVLDAILYAYVLALLHLVLFGGFTIQLGLFRVSAHSYAPLILPLAGLVLLRWWQRGAPFRGLRRFLIAPLRRRSLRGRPAATLLPAAIATVALVMALRPASGLVGRYFVNPQWEGAPALVVLDSAPTLQRIARDWFETDYSVEWTGVIEISRDGPYRFALDSDDGSALWIDDRLVVDNLGAHAPLKIEATSQLTRGFHALRLRYMQERGGTQLLATWASLGGDEEPLGSASLFATVPSPFSLAVFRVARVLQLIVKVLILALLAAGLLAGSDALFERGRAAAIAAVEVGLLATLTVSLWTVGFGWFPRMRAWLPAGLAVVFVVRRLARGTFGGALALPRQAWGFLRAARAAMSRRRAALVALTVTTASVVLLVGAVTESQRGLVGHYYSNPDWTGDVIVAARDRALGRQRFAYDFVDPDNLTSVEWYGAISIPTAGDYQFALTAAGDSALWIDDILIVEGRGVGGPTRKTAMCRLAPGFHAIRLRYSDDRDSGTPWSAEWSRGIDAPMQPLSSAALFVAAPDRSRLAYSWYRFSTGVLSIAWAIWLIGVTLAWLIVCDSLLEHPRVVEGYSVHFALMIALAACYALTAWLGLRQLWGFAALGLEAVRIPPIFLLLFLLPVLTYRRWPVATQSALGRAQAYVAARPLAVVAAATCASLVFFWLRNGHVNSDGVMYRWLTPEIVSGESPVGFDEMWEGFLHAWFRHWTHAAFGWSVRLSYQVMSSAAGGAFLVVLWLYGRRIVPQLPLAFCVLMLGGGYMQLFFGEVENYTLTAVLIVGYLLASASFLQTRTPLIVPSVALAVAMTFHMLAGFRLPSLLCLYVVAIRRRAYRGVALAVIASAALFIATMVVLKVPLQSFYQDSWAGASMRVLIGNALPTNPFGEGPAQLARHWAFFRFDQYHWDQYNLLALMFPAHLALLTLLLPGRTRWDATNVHLLVAAAGMAFFQFNYRGMLPLASDDWNLYACAALPLAAFVWRNLLSAESSPLKGPILISWGTLSFVHSFAWILANSRYVP